MTPEIHPDKFDLELKKIAQWLEDEYTVHYLYAVFDSLSSSYSMFTYFFYVIVNDPDPNALHDFMMQPQWYALFILEASFMVSYSLLAALSDKKKKEMNLQLDPNLKIIADSWPFFRDVMKGIKNSYKGWRSVILAYNALNLVNYTHLIIPYGIALSIFGALNRYMLRQIYESRKAKKDMNKDLLSTLPDRGVLNNVDRMEILQRDIHTQDFTEKFRGYIGAGLGGIIDGCYNYAGLMTIATLTPHTLAIVASFCSFYIASSFLLRLFEEYEFQLELEVTATICRMHVIKALAKNTTDNNDKLKLIEDFEKERATLISLKRRSNWFAILIGFKYGMYAYSAVSALINLISMFCLISATPLPTVIIFIGVPLGLLFMAWFIYRTVHLTTIHNNTSLNDSNLNNPDRAYYKLLHKNAAEQVDSIDLDVGFEDGLIIEDYGQLFTKEKGEIARSLFSGVTKGQKFIDFAFIFLQRPNEDGVYRDTTLSYFLITISVVVFATILALRAIAKEIGRDESKKASARLGQTPQPTPRIPLGSVRINRSHTIDTNSEEPRQTSATPSPSIFQQWITFFGQKKVHNQLLTQYPDNSKLSPNGN